MSVNADTGQSEAPAVTWRDRKRYMWLWGLFPVTAVFIALPVVYGLNYIGWDPVSHVLWWVGPILIYVLIPTFDLFFGPDGENPPEEAMEYLENDKYYRYLTYAFIPLQYGTLLLACYLITADNLSWLGIDGSLRGWDQIGLAISVGCLGGIGINTAHELGHKKEDLERWLSRITLAQTFYGHFYIEHNRGHHVRVATPEDPASSRFGETFWGFWPRTVSGSFKSSWSVEKTRLQRLGKSAWSLQNEVLTAWLMSAALWAVLVGIFGIKLLPFLVLQAIIGFSLLEAVNYLEHYGLMRQKTASGRYERPAPEHSWNSDHIVTNILLYHLQRHSDHHAYPTRRYQTLRSWDGAPNLPSGYASMILLAYFPPIWRKVMDPKVLAHYNGDITKANIQPSKRTKILAKYGVTEDAQ